MVAREAHGARPKPVSHGLTPDERYLAYAANCRKFGWGEPAPFERWQRVTDGSPAPVDDGAEA